jgi:hypothetical protein
MTHAAGDAQPMDPAPKGASCGVKVCRWRAPPVKCKFSMHDIDDAREAHIVGIARVFAAAVGPSLSRSAILRQRKLFGQIMVRHMCAVGEPSKPNPSSGSLKWRPMMSVNISGSIGSHFSKK